MAYILLVWVALMLKWSVLRVCVVVGMVSYAAGFLHGVEVKTTQIESLCADDKLLFDLYCCPVGAGEKET